MRRAEEEECSGPCRRSMRGWRSCGGGGSLTTRPQPAAAVPDSSLWSGGGTTAGTAASWSARPAPSGRSSSPPTTGPSAPSRSAPAATVLWSRYLWGSGLFAILLTAPPAAGSADRAISGVQLNTAAPPGRKVQLQIARESQRVEKAVSDTLWRREVLNEAAERFPDVYAAGLSVEQMVGFIQVGGLRAVCARPFTALRQRAQFVCASGSLLTVLSACRNTARMSSSAAESSAARRPRWLAG